MITTGMVYAAAEAFGRGRLALDHDQDRYIDDFRRVQDYLCRDRDCRKLIAAGACCAGIVTYERVRGVAGGLEHALRAWPMYAVWVEESVEGGHTIPYDLLEAYVRITAAAPLRSGDTR